MKKVLAGSSLITFPLSEGGVRRYEKERQHPGFLAPRVTPSAHPCVIVCRGDGKELLTSGTAAWLHPLPLHASEPFLTVPLSQAVYVGEDAMKSRNVFVVGPEEVHASYIEQRAWTSVRALLSTLAATDQALLGLAVSMKQWALTTSFCSYCGASMQSMDYGMTRECSVCRKKVYPTVSPAMIVAVLDGKGSVIMSRRHGHNFTAKGKPIQTVLSGFVAQGESMEETVVREVLEETGANVTTLRYVGSQPWPAPYELMTCYYAVAEDSPHITAHDGELLSVHWVPKEEVRKALAGEHPDFEAPPGYTASHLLLDGWVKGLVDDHGRPSPAST